MPGRSPRLFPLSSLLLLVLAGCTLPILSRPAVAPASREVQETETFDLAAMTAEEYSRFTESLEHQLAAPPNPQSPPPADALRRLALLYLVPDNPLRDEQKASERLQAYVASLPPGTPKIEDTVWLEILREKLALEKERQALMENNRKEVTALEAEKKRMAGTIKELTGKNDKLNRDIEKLKMIDLAVEKKRKSYR